jgi:glycosyltransferase involved in cell wall biosynthesis
MKYKLVRLTTVSISLQKLIAGQMKFMSNNGFEVTMISSDFDDKGQLEMKESAKFIPVNMTRIISPFADLRSLYQLIRVLTKLRPAIVHTHTPKAGLIGMLASWITGVPIRLHTVAGLPLMEAKGLKRFILVQVEKLAYACATKVYPNSNHLKEFITEHKFTYADKLKVIGGGSSNGIDTKAFIRSVETEQQDKEIYSKYNLSGSDFTFIFIGRLVKDKGVEELIRAFAQLSTLYPQLKLLLVGPEEPELDPLSATCLKEVHENPSIISVGYKDDVRPYLAISNVLTFPSYREGFPNVPMQAGCFDLPCIVTNINGCNEIIVEGENGLIIPVKDAISLYAAMEKLYLDTVLYKSMSSKARKMIVDRYEQQKVWELILAEYHEHLNKKGIVK